MTIAVGTVVLAVVSQMFGTASVLGVVLVCFVLAVAGRRLRGFTVAWASTALLVSVVIVLMQTIFIAGERVLVEVWIFDATVEGMQRGWLFAQRILGVATPIVLAVQLVSRRRLMLELERRRVSPKVTYVVVAALNLIPQMREQMTTILDAQRARGVETDANWFVRVRAFLPTLVQLILASVLSVEEKALALQARGFTLSGPRTSLYAVLDTAADRAIRRVLLALLLAAVAGRLVLWVL